MIVCLQDICDDAFKPSKERYTGHIILQLAAMIHSHAGSADPEIVHLTDIAPRAQIFTRFEQHRHAKAHWFSECFAEFVSTRHKQQCPSSTDRFCPTLTDGRFPVRLRRYAPFFLMAPPLNVLSRRCWIHGSLGRWKRVRGCRILLWVFR